MSNASKSTVGEASAGIIQITSTKDFQGEGMPCAYILDVPQYWPEIIPMRNVTPAQKLLETAKIEKEESENGNKGKERTRL